MAYRIKGKNGLPIKKDGNFVMGFDLAETKIEQLDDKNLTFLAVASTEDEDRDKDIIRVDGWKLQNFSKNPVLPWGHNYYEPPVGKALSIKKDKAKKKLIFKPQFDSNDDKAKLIFNKYKNGFLNTVSVGFIGLDFAWRDEENRWFGGREYLKQELLEISPVTIPANPNANMDIRSFSDDLPTSLLQLGYKQFACDMETGLFIPINDTELYTDAKVMAISKGIQGVFASAIDNPDSEKELVGYVFNPDDVTEVDAKTWVSDNAPSKTKIRYFDMAENKIGEEEFELNIIEEEIDVKFETSESEEEESPEFDSDTDAFDLEEDEEEKDLGDTEERPDGDGVETKDESDEEENEDDPDDGITDKTITDDNNDEEKTPEEENNQETKEVDIDALAEKVFLKVKELLIENKILVVKENDLDNNENTDSAIELLEEEETTKSNEEIEFDESVFSPVTDNDNSEDLIEIDDDSLKDFSLHMSKTLKGDLESALNKAVKDAFSEFSGKLEN